jgi:uncharacterized membrane protein YgcG
MPATTSANSSLSCFSFGTTSLLSGLHTPSRYLHTLSRLFSVPCPARLLPHVAAQLIWQAVLCALAQTRHIDHLPSRDNKRVSTGSRGKHRAHRVDQHDVADGVAGHSHARALDATDFQSCETGPGCSRRLPGRAKCRSRNSSGELFFKRLFFNAEGMRKEGGREGGREGGGREGGGREGGGGGGGGAPGF